jgi:hypothetical protein
VSMLDPTPVISQHISCDVPMDIVSDILVSINQLASGLNPLQPGAASLQCSLISAALIPDELLGWHCLAASARPVLGLVLLKLGGCLAVLLTNQSSSGPEGPLPHFEGSARRD